MLNVKLYELSFRDRVRERERELVVERDNYRERNQNRSVIGVKGITRKKENIDYEL